MDTQQPLTHLPGRTISPGTYTAGCRCDGCRTAWRNYVADRRAS